ncbi:TetR/AcrR family transcriptional regulator [Sporolactobacillus shoreae]|uniref:TetR/AcrR family transcriptional regulator n=1 Tax=Sporolactobacillus shoreae TaxID=1465501 RepID=A0A4Z0GPQ4_9BACL|nr:TetR/AcrR family transcriptional regulator [Sporolactobacillus shoreae]TGA98426.1 TetR/AcrR family transcriptional regulator [Sporolactobacillus shoreae]
MSEVRPIRKPRQSRGVASRAKIVDAAFELFQEKGYYGTNTEEIAKAADVSIGCLYSYFKDRDDLFREVLNQRQQIFLQLLPSEPITIKSKEDIREWLTKQINRVAEFQKRSWRIYTDIRSLSFSSPAVLRILTEQRNHRLHMAMEFFNTHKQIFKVEDIEAAAVLFCNLISVTTEQIAFRENDISEERIVQAVIDALMAYLFI